MKKRFWKLEYSLTIFFVFAIVLMLIPTSFITSKEAGYISKWNDTFHKMEYIITAMQAQADAEIVKSFKRTETNEEREKLMMRLLKPYLRISDSDELTKKYTPHFMNGTKVQKNDYYYFESLYIGYNGKIIGFKDIQDEEIYLPAFIMLFDMNGLKGPNTWGKDIFGINIYVDGKINPIGSGWEISEMQKDCSEQGSGVSCSHYYRIGGDFKE